MSTMTTQPKDALEIMRQALREQPRTTEAPSGAVAEIAAVMREELDREPYRPGGA